MPLPNSGPISLGDVSGTLGQATASSVGLGDGNTRALLGVLSGAISLNDAYGKSAAGGPAIGDTEILLVAGGGGGGRSGDDGGGGGGAGGYLYLTTVNLLRGTYTVTVGAGGAATGLPSGGTDGTNSSGFGYTAIGGGAGGGRSGGSGGGGNSTNYPNPGAGTVGQGNNGGGAYGGHYTPGGGGGGAGAVGATPGAGGIGLANSINGTSTYYAGGGGGANLFGAGYAGGLGGGGAGGGPEGGPSGNGSPGTANTGGGGGGGTAGFVSAAAGGSGIVIVAYPGVTPKATGGTISTSIRPGYVVHTFTSTGQFVF
jgi:hypothetical protein